MSDYISRDELLELYAPDPAIPNFDDLKLTVAVVRQNVLDMPAADVVPVRHGKWIHPHWRNSVSAADCSECGAEAQHIEYRGVQKHYRICPSCGARMDKEDEHETD